MEDSVNASEVIRHNLKRLRGEKRLTAAALGDRLEVLGSTVTSGTIAKIESGHRARVYDSELLELAAALEAPLGELFAPPEGTHLQIGRQTIHSLEAGEWVRGLGVLRWSDGDLEYWTLPERADQLEAEADRLRTEVGIRRQLGTASGKATSSANARGRVIKE